MKQPRFILLFVGVNVFFVFFVIYKNSKIVDLTYTKQKHEKERVMLAKEKELLHQELCVAQNRSTIKDFAQTNLCMNKIKLKDLKQLPRS